MISVQHLNKTYAQRKVLCDLSTCFPARQLSSLIGPNGAGKSTLLMLMARLLKADSGQILLNGRSVAGIGIAEYARQVATLRQSNGFNLRLSVQELVAFGRFPHSRGRLTATDQRAIDEAIDFLGLTALRHRLLDELSGGQRQLALLAMTLAQQTDVLLLDEPLNNLDMRHAVELMQALRRLCDEHARSVVLVIHDINFAANYSDHIVALKDGRLHFSGATDEVLSAARLSALFGLEFEILQGTRARVCNYFKPNGACA